MRAGASHEVAGVEGGELGGVAGGEAEAPEAASAAFAHVLLELRHPVVAQADRVWVPRPGGEHDEGVENALVEPRGVPQRVMSSFDGAPEACTQVGSVARRCSRCAWPKATWRASS